MKNRASLWATLFILPICVSPVSAQITWDNTGGIDVAVDGSVITTGLPVYAYNTGSVDSHTVNGVTFVGTAAGGVADLNGDGNVIFDPVDSGTTAGFSNAGGLIEALLDSAQWGLPGAMGPDTITLGNLTPGEDYLVQLFSSDTRGTRNNTLVLDQGEANEFSSFLTGSNTNTPPGGNGAWVSGTFTADVNGEASFTFIYASGTGNANINAIQVRTFDEITLLGDFNEDTFVDVDDFLILSGNLAGELDGPVSYFDGDIDFDFDVDLDDFAQFKALYPAVVAAATAAAPEPHSFGLLAVASGLLVNRGRSRRVGR